MGSVDVRPLHRIQGARARERKAVQGSIPTGLCLPPRKLCHCNGRERCRVPPLLQRASSESLCRVGDRNLLLEGLSTTTEEGMADRRGANPRRWFAVWTHGRPPQLVGYNARTRGLRVSPRDTSSEDPRCGGRPDPPVWKRSRGVNGQGDGHRDRVGATSLLSRGESALGGTALSPSVLNALLEKARWGVGSAGASMNADDARLVGGA